MGLRAPRLPRQALPQPSLAPGGAISFAPPPPVFPQAAAAPAAAAAAPAAAGAAAGGLSAPLTAGITVGTQLIGGLFSAAAQRAKERRQTELKAVATRGRTGIEAQRQLSSGQQQAFQSLLGSFKSALL